MRKIIIILTLVCFPFLVPAQQSILPLVPWPVEVKMTEGYLPLKKTLTVSAALPGHEWTALFRYFRDEMKKQFNITVAENRKPGTASDIRFTLRRMPTSGKPAYELDVTSKEIVITSNFNESAFQAIQTLFQLIPTDANAKKEIPGLHIFDYARFDYRGMHFDVCRHFFPVSYVKKYIDWLAYHKLNVFHWHLTDDQGWRIEIKKYPGLTKTGAWRNGTIIGRYPGIGNDNIPYGGFYTQAQIREVVQYAKERFIDVIPEIEMPGHSSAAIAAYPWLSCFPDKPTAIPANMISRKSVEEQQKGRIKLVQETWGVFEDVFCAGNDSTFMFLQNVIDEVTALFPSKYFHIGGDECPKTHWKICPKCQQRIKDLKLKDEHELQSYLVQRIEKYLNSKGRTLIGWDEILEGGLAPKAVVMSWRGEQGGIDAAKQDHDVIMTPGNPVYFDHTQSQNEDSVTIGGYNPIEKVYAYEPVPAVLTEEQGRHVLGAQANLWTEYIGNARKVEYMLFPRMAALSEVLWSAKQDRSWESFEQRLPGQFKRYERWGVNYSRAYYDLKATVIPTDDNRGVQWKLESKLKEGFIGYPPQRGSSAVEKYSKPIPVTHSDTLQGCYFLNNKPVSCVQQKFRISLATGRKISLAQPPSKTYPGDGAFTLVNGVINEKGTQRATEFLGFSGDNCEAVIDLGESKQVSYVVVNSLNRTASWIWRPLSAEVFGSGDGQSWYSLKRTDDADEKPGGKCMMTLAFRATYARYIKVIVTNQGTIPEGNPGAGNKAWLFVDEIEVMGPNE